MPGLVEASPMANSGAWDSGIEIEAIRLTGSLGFSSNDQTTRL